MSLYKSIKKTLFGLYKSKQKGHSKRRLLTMTAIITGLLRSKKGTIHSIGKRFPSKSDLESRIKRVKRLLGNKWNFGNMKSRGFNIHQTKVKKPDIINGLLLIVSWAYVWLAYLGKFAKKQPDFAKYARKD